MKSHKLCFKALQCTWHADVITFKRLKLHNGIWQWLEPVMHLKINYSDALPL